jgi:hypothetical protein
MPVTVHWLIPNRAILFTGFGTVLLPELVEGNSLILELLAQGQPPIHVVSDTSQNLTFPSPLDMRNAVTYLNSPVVGQAVVGGVGNMFLHFIVKMMGKMTNKPITLHNSVEEALRYLQRQDPSLPDLMSVYREYKQQQTAPSA